MVKKKCRNAFYYFMIAYKDKHPEITTMQQASDQAGAVWENMTQSEKQSYEDIVKQKKRDPQLKKYTSIGEPIDNIEKAEAEQVQQEYDMKDDIKIIISIAYKAQSLENEIFCVGHINDFFYCNSDRRYYPAEIAVISFNLKDGILDQFHRIITPQTIPLGYSYYAKERADQLHKIRIDPTAEPTDMKLVFREIKELLMDKENGNALRAIYFTAKQMAVAENVMDALAGDMGYGKRFFKIYSLEYMFYQLKNNVANDSGFPTASLAEIELDKDIFEFTDGKSCQFHEHSDAPNTCSLSIATRLIYSICNYCCQDLDIALIPGRHVPQNAAVNSGTNKNESDDDDDCRSSYAASSVGYVKDESCYTASEDYLSCQTDACSISDIDTRNYPSIGDPLSKMEDRASASSYCSFPELDNENPGFTQSSSVSGPLTNTQTSASTSTEMRRPGGTSRVSGMLGNPSSSGVVPIGRGRGRGLMF